MSDGASDGFRVDQPQPNDLVGESLLLAGVGGGFEGTILVRVLDGTGAVLRDTSLLGTNLTSAWQTSVDLPDPPPTKEGVVEVGSGSGAAEAPPRVSVPVFFGTAIVPGFRSYFCYTVQPGDTLSGIAREQQPLYIGSGWEPIYDANRHIIADPGVIHPGTVLRLPANF